MSIAAAAPTPVQRSLVREGAYTDLRSRIVDGTLAPGDRLRDKEIAAKLGVSRTPVREALRRLEDEGLVETASSRWTRVAPLDIQHALETYVIIDALEAVSLRMAWDSLAEREVRALTAFNDRMIEAMRRRDGKRGMTADASFHNVWIGRSGNSELVRLILQIKVRLRRVELAYSKAAGSELQAYEEHREIIRGIKGGSPGRAVDALKQNWRSATNRLYQRAVGPLGLADRTGWL